MEETRVVRGRHQPEKQEMARQMRREMTPAEAHLWQHLRAGRLAGLHFRRQQIIDGFIADFYCHAAKLVVELDGEIHQSTVDYDQERDAIVASHGLRILRFSNTRLDAELHMVLDEIETTARSIS